jgi:DNA-binding response OmpR family regulator
MAQLLVVDDDPDIVELVTLRLSRKGYAVSPATSAEAALEMVSTLDGVDLAILDVTMPEMSGLDLLVQLREKLGRPDLPAIFLSGKVEDDAIAAGRALGAHHLAKPFVASALFEAVEALAGPA